ncbi:hypothetical protein ACJ72_08042 [Emergomyces africanus]|uniref:Uncharacterized protein n=1 Tax=Emergomyces africanus TaxID=1955775 RepID=A0A1B7NLZ9_9EURO|nr:hypothetical protein ACJ72_08042 [Emergomyces africanus]
MKHSVILFTALGLASLSAAVPKYNPWVTDPMFGSEDTPWDWCSREVTCYDDSDCITPDCQQVAGRSTAIICGWWPWWPHSCWTFIKPLKPANSTS